MAHLPLEEQMRAAYRLFTKQKQCSAVSSLSVSSASVSQFQADKSGDTGLPAASSYPATFPLMLSGSPRALAGRLVSGLASVGTPKAGHRPAALKVIWSVVLTLIGTGNRLPNACR